MSEGSQTKARNLRGPKEATKHNSWDCLRYWFAPVLLRGKAHVILLGTAFPGENARGAEVLVGRVRAAINIRCQGTRAPKTLFVDRGKGFYNPNHGAIVHKFRDALREHDLKAFNGDDGSKQPGNLQEAMLHETLMAWVRKRLERTKPKKPWEETVEQYGQRLQEVFQYINDNYDVESLCGEFLERVQRIKDARGDRISK